MEEKLFLARELSSCLGGIEVQLISAGDDSLHRFIADSIYANVLPIVSPDTLRTMLQDMQPDCLYIFSGILDLCYVVIRRQDHSFLCAGPCVEREFSESRVRTMLRPFHLSGTAAERMVEYCRWLPVLTQETLHRFGILLCRHVLGIPEPILHRKIDYRWYQSGLPPIPEPEPEASRIHRVEQRYKASAALTEAVKQGNLSLAYSFVQGFHPGMSEIARTPNPLRNAQNICIILNTQLRYALEECRIHPYRLDRVSGDIARHIETLRTPEAAGKFCVEIIRRYCELSMEEHYSGLNRLTRQAVVYIKTHLNDSLTVKDTAKALLVNANYLSHQFHRDMGMTFIDFVNRERTSQAAALLKHTNMQIQQIAATVGYNNTSYFAKQFVKFMNMTPREFRSSGVL